MRRIFFFLTFLCISTGAFAAERPGDLLGRLRVCLLDANGVKLKLKTIAVEDAQPFGLVWRRFQFKNEEIVLSSCVDTLSKTIVCRVESPHLESGDVSIGLQFPKENRLPKLSVTRSRATFDGKREQTFIGWTGPAAVTAPKPRQELKVSLAEYGATDRWKDVTDIVRDHIVGDSLEFRAGNALFGDPAGGVVKSLVLNYSLDDDELIQTYAENQTVRIQFDPKDQFFRLNGEKKPTLELVVSSKALPEKLPTFEEAQKNARAVDGPGW